MCLRPRTIQLPQCPIQSSARQEASWEAPQKASSLPCSLSPNQARSSCPGSLDSSTYLNSDFLLPEDPKPKLPPTPAPPPLLQYPSPAKGLGLEPCPPPPFPPMAPPPALLQEEPLFSPRFAFPAIPPAPGVSGLSAPTAFPPTPQPGPGPAPFPIDLLPSGYSETPFGPHFLVPQGTRPRGKPPAPTPRGRKPGAPAVAPATASPTATAGSNNPCLTQLLTAGEWGHRRDGDPVRTPRACGIRGCGVRGWLSRRSWVLNPEPERGVGY